jgi:hypothetical protein
MQKNMELATLFTVQPGLANLQNLCPEFPTFDARHSLTYQIWLNGSLTSIVEEIKATREADNHLFRSDKLDIVSGRVSGCVAGMGDLTGFSHDECTLSRTEVLPYRRLSTWTTPDSYKKSDGCH